MLRESNIMQEEQKYPLNSFTNAPYARDTKNTIAEFDLIDFKIFKYLFAKILYSI